MSKNGRARWRDPVIPVEWYDDPDHVEIRPDGSIRRVEIAVLKWPDIQRMRQGYVCAYCFEPQETPFPDVCSCKPCSFPMAARQTEFMAANYRGNHRTGPDPAAEEDQRARVQELRDRENRENAEMAGWRNTGTILVPQGIVSAP